MKNVFIKDTPIPQPSRGAFDLSHETELSTKIGKLTPAVWMPVVPGDKIRLRTEMLVKFAPMLRPVLHRIDAYMHFFWVPNRLLMHPVGTTQGGWKDFITGDPDGEFTTSIPPYVTLNEANDAYYEEGTLADYLGLPTPTDTVDAAADTDINVLPAFAYHLIYDYFYRDENLVERVTGESVGTGSIDLVGGDRNAEVQWILPEYLHNRAYEKDYFHGALPTPYTGSSGDVELDIDMTYDLGLGNVVRNAATGATMAGAPTSMDIGADGIAEMGAVDVIVTDASVQHATLEIMELRRAEAITRWLEAERRGGHRYNEMLLGVFGVISDNMETDIPVYLGGGKQAINISTVLNQSEVLDPTAGANDGAGGVPVSLTPEAYETGKGVGAGSTRTANLYAKEHGIIMGIFSVLPRTCYTGGIEREWTKFDRESYFVPQLQNIGDQEILNQELGWDLDTNVGNTNEDTWGYAPRWSEYKFKNSTVHGAFKTSLDNWHMARINNGEAAVQGLNNTFVTCIYSQDENVRIFADDSGTEDELYCQFYHDIQAIRPMQVHDIPR